MRLLLDTHVVLWWLMDEPALPADVKTMVDEEPDVFVSPATLWEIAIKQAAGKIEAPDDLAERILGADLIELPIRSVHAVAAGRLPPIHRDPFDRMLIAQARKERLTLVTRDKEIHKYDVEVLTA